MAIEDAKDFYLRLMKIDNCQDAIDAISKRDLAISIESAELKITNEWLREVWLDGCRANFNNSCPFRDPEEPYEECPY